MVERMCAPGVQNCGSDELGRQKKHIVGDHHPYFKAVCSSALVVTRWLAVDAVAPAPAGADCPGRADRRADPFTARLSARLTPGSSSAPSG